MSLLASAQTASDDSALAAALFLFASLAVAYGLWLLAHYAGIGGRRAIAFHRRGVARLRAHRQRQEHRS